MVRQLLLLLLFMCSCLSVALSSCSCPAGTLSRTSDCAIIDDFNSSTNVYVAVVSAADCKCYPQSNTTTRLDCLSYVISENNMVTESVGKRYECLLDDGFFFGTTKIANCDDVNTTLVSTATVGPIPDLPPITNVTGEGNCVPSYSGEGCQLTKNPCSYNVTVGTVYKGKLTTGDVIVTPGPDVDIACGQYGRVLTLGVKYVVGIGGACNPKFTEWSTLESYSDSDVALLENLTQQGAEDIHASTCNSAKGSHLIYTFLFPLLILLSFVA